MIWEWYLELSKFIEYCERLNIKTSKDELEHYEKEGLMLPRARVFYPLDYIKAKKYADNNHKRFSSNGWPEVTELFDTDRFFDHEYAKMTDEELVHSFDRAFEKGNKYLHNPELEDFKPWRTYPKMHFQVQGIKSKEETVEHFYAYWQVHQLYFLQKYPDLYFNRDIIQILSKRNQDKLGLPRAFSSEIYRNFKKNGLELVTFYNGFTFFLTSYLRERERGFSTVQEKYNVKQLDGTGYNNLKKAYFKHAQSTCNKFRLSENDLFRFLYGLLELRREYLNAEKQKLTNLIELDISLLFSFIWCLTGKTWGEVSEELPTYEDKLQFRNIDPETKRSDDSRKILVGHFQKIGEWNLTPAPNANYIDEIIKFCQENDLDIFLHTLSDFIGGPEETRKFLPQTRYTTLKNFASFFEYFLKALATKAGVKIYNITRIRKKTGVSYIVDPTIGPVIEELTHKVISNNIKWFSNYTKASKSAKNMQELVQNLQKANTIPEPVEKNVVIACLTRNFTTHNYTLEDEFYDEMFGELSSGTLCSILYFWHLAKIEGWV